MTEARAGEGGPDFDTNTSENECPHPDCGVPIAETSFCCLTHWKALGRAGRERITKNRLGHDEALRIAGQHWFPEEDR